MYSRNDIRSYYENENELYHFGVKGQKKGIRRYQYEDGSLTPLGREHYGYGQARETKGTTEDRDLTRAIQKDVANMAKGYEKAQKNAVKAAKLEKQANDLQKRISRNQDKSNNLNIKLNKKAVDAAKLDTKLLKLDSDTDKFVKVNEKLNKTDAKVAKIDTEIRKLDKSIKKDSEKLVKVLASRDLKISDLSDEEIAAGRLEMERSAKYTRNQLIGGMIGATAGAVATTKVPILSAKAGAFFGGTAGIMAATAGTLAVDVLTGKEKKYSEANLAGRNAYLNRSTEQIAKKYNLGSEQEKGDVSKQVDRDITKIQMQQQIQREMSDMFQQRLNQQINMQFQNQILLDQMHHM